MSESSTFLEFLLVLTIRPLRTLQLKSKLLLKRPIENVMVGIGEHEAAFSNAGRWKFGERFTYYSKVDVTFSTGPLEAV